MTTKSTTDNTADPRLSLLKKLVFVIEDTGASADVVADVAAGIFLSAMMHAKGPKAARQTLLDLAGQLEGGVQ